MRQETVGIDMAAQARATAACTVVWEPAEATINHVEAGLEDGRLLRLLSSGGTAQRIGVDVPLGWPIAFVDALTRHHRGEPWGDLEDPPKGKSLTHRATDRWVHDQPDLKLWPLSVSTDRIAYSAMRMARLLGQLGHTDRSGGRVVEVYPAAALKGWGLNPRQYKGPDGRMNLSLLLQHLREATPWLKAEDAIWRQVEGDDNQFDALICALVARAAARNLCRQLPPEHRAAATAEGWIHVPFQGSLERLLGG